MHDELVFNPRKMSVKMVEAELAKQPDLTVAQLKALLAHEGSQVRSRVGVEKLLDARLLALAEEAIEAASEDMTAEGAPDPEVEAEEEDEDEPASGRMIFDAEGSEPLRMFGEQPVLLAAAILAHETNRAYCALLGDDSQTSWEDAPQWQQDSALDGVTAIHRDPMTTPEQSHIGWLAQKEADGWVYGETKDAEAKTHPCMVPYGDLPEDQRLKDSLFGTVVRLILGEPGTDDRGDRLNEVLGAMSAEELGLFGLCRMMGPDPDRPMEPEGHVDSEEAARVAHYEELLESGLGDHEARCTAWPDAIAEGTPVHVQMTEKEVHTGYYMKPQAGAMIRMRDGQDTIIYKPEGSFWVSPPEKGVEDEGSD